MRYKYPYIPKGYYAAVMFACKIIRENGTFNRAISAAARYYDVDKDELAKHVRSRQGAGQKGQTRAYHWYSVIYYKGSMYGDEGYIDWWQKTASEILSEARVRVVKATSEENAKNAIEKEASSYGRYSEPTHSTHLFIEVSAFDSQKEADSHKPDKWALLEAIKRRSGCLDGVRGGV